MSRVSVPPPNGTLAMSITDEGVIRLSLDGRTAHLTPESAVAIAAGLLELAEEAGYDPDEALDSLAESATAAQEAARARNN